MSSYDNILSNERLVVFLNCSGEFPAVSQDQKYQISQFLQQFKYLAQKEWTFVERKKNLDFLAEMGITPRSAKEIVLGLKVGDYCSGPEPDYDRSSYNIWTFNIQKDGCEIYIKLSDDFRGLKAKCISFHKAEHAMKRPFAGEEEKND